MVLPADLHLSAPPKSVIFEIKGDLVQTEQGWIEETIEFALDILTAVDDKRALPTQFQRTECQGT